MHQCIKFILFWNDTLHVSDGLSGVQDCTYSKQAYVKQILLSDCYPLAGRQQYLFDKCLLLYVRS